MSVFDLAPREGRMAAPHRSRSDAIYWEIVEPIEAAGRDVAGAERFDIDAIADEVLGIDEHGHYYARVDADEFWRVVERHAYPEGVFRAVLLESEPAIRVEHGGDDEDLAALPDGRVLPALISHRDTGEQFEPEVYAEALAEAGWQLLSDWEVVWPGRYTAKVQAARKDT